MIHARVGRHHLAQDLLQPLAFCVGQFAADPGRRRTRQINEVATGQLDTLVVSRAPLCRTGSLLTCKRTTSRRA